MKTIHQLEVYCGTHLIVEQSETLREYEAFLKSLNGGHLIARRGATPGTITLCRCYYRCAACFEPFPMPSVPLDKSGDADASPNFFDWALQSSMFGTSVFDDTFYFRDPPDAQDEVCCPHCKMRAKAGKDYTQYSLSTDADQTVIVQSVTQYDRHKLLPLTVWWKGPGCYPLNIQLIFNHKTRCTLFCIQDHNNKVVWYQDITEQVAPLNGFAMERHISAHTELKERLLRIFKDLAGGVLPFFEEDICLATLILLNRFQGFPRDFYAPYLLYAAASRWKAAL